MIYQKNVHQQLSVLNKTLINIFSNFQGISNFKKQSILFLKVLIKEKIVNCHLASKLNNTKINPKTYWSILKSFYSGKKIPLIPPLLLHNNKLISDFREKANLFNSFFGSQYTMFANNSTRVSHGCWEHWGEALQNWRAGLSWYMGVARREGLKWCS